MKNKKFNQWCTYMVECSDGSIYTGISNNVNKRVSDHNSSKGSKYTKSRLPVVLKWFKKCVDRSDASKLEYKIKKLSRKEKLKLIKMKNKVENQSSFSLSPLGYYKVDISKIETIDDVKVILKYMELSFSPKDEECLAEMRKFLIIN